MKNSKSITSVFILLALSIISVTVQAQRPSARVTDRQAGVILQRLERDSLRFRNSLNAALVQGRVDQTSPQNNINTFRPNFENATAQFKGQLTRRRASAADVRNILEKATLINDFLARHRLTPRVQNNWASVRTDLNALANVYGVNWHWDHQAALPVNSNRSRLSDSELNQLIRRIDTGGDTFRWSLTEAFGQSRYDRTRNEANMNDAVRGFKQASEQLRNQFDARRPIAEYVERVLVKATPIDTYMRSNQLTNRVQSDWSTVRADLNTLAGAHNLTASWQYGDVPPVRYSSNSRLTGTFRLDSARSDNPREMADRATQNISNSERRDISERMLERLESPEMLAIERRGSTITMASSRARQATFEADGVERQEQLANGSSSRVTATLRGDQLGVSSTGSRDTDFKVTFESIENGSRLRVRREIYSDRLTQPIVVNSIYNRSADVAHWNIYNAATAVPGYSGTNNGEFIVRDNETVVAVLNNELTSKDTKPGDRFTMTVREPGQYEGAVIEGTVAGVDQGGRLTGRSGLSLDFDTIRLRNGRTYSFAGVLSSVRTPNGDNVNVDNEGSAQGDNQTTQTIQRGGIGTAIGAVIGAIAGGAKGAVIGAVVGAAGGAGSVYVQGKDNFELPRGTELTVRASAPGR